MTPFLHFRSWLRSGPAGERVLSAVAGVALLSLLLWASTPFPGGGGQTTLVSSGPAAGATSRGAGDAGAGAGPAGSGGPAAAAVSGGTAGGVRSGPTRSTSGAGTIGSAASGGSSAGAVSGKGCVSTGATDTGVTATTITLGIVIVDLGAASNLIAVPSAANQQKAWNAVFADINNKGGVLCRKLVPKFYTDGVFDTSQEHAACLSMQQDKVFAVFNNLFNTTEQTCIAKAHIPNIWYTPPHTPDVRKYSPYIMSWQADFDQLIHQYVFGAKAQGFFAGMKKLGILKQSCYPDEIVALDKELTAAGIDPAQATVVDEGCSQSPNNPQLDTQAALTFQRAGVTHIVNVAYANDASLSQAADQQNYYPKFAHMEDASATAIETGTSKPGKSFNGTVLISAIQTGAAHTPGYRFNKPTQDCTKLLASAGLPSAYSAGVAALYGIACIDGALFKAMAEHAPALKRDQLNLGLTRLGALDLAYPGGPVDVANPQVPTGGQLARPGVWETACECWKVTDARFRAY